MSEVGAFRDKATLIEALRRARQQLEARLSPLLTVGDAHTSAWDAVAEQAIRVTQVVTALFQLERGVAAKLDQALTVPPNAVAEQRTRPPERLLADFRNVHHQLLRRLEAWRDEVALFDARRFAALRGQSLAAWIWQAVGATDLALAERLGAAPAAENGRALE